MIELKQALELFDRELAGRTTDIEILPLASAAGRLLATDVESKLDLPPFHKSAMDGYALPVGDRRDRFRVIETVAAGTMPARRLEPGLCSQIMTGAPLPEGADRVVQVEHVERSGDEIRIVTGSSNPNVCKLGEDVRRGDVVGHAGDELDPILRAVLISCGIEEVAVRKTVQAAVYSTGDELVASMAEYRPGKIFDSNGPLLVHLLRQHGGQARLVDRLPDDPALMAAALERALVTCDLVFLTGGVSAGEFDYIPGVLRQLGLTVQFSRVRIKPGKPMTFASGSEPNRLTGHLPPPVLGFPGNPVSTFVMFHVFGLRALYSLQARRYEPRRLRLIMAEGFKRSRAERLEFAPAALDHDGAVKLIDYHGSAHFAALRAMEGFILVNPGVHEIRAGEPVIFWPLRVSSVDRG